MEEVLKEKVQGQIAGGFIVSYFIFFFFFLH